MKLHRCLSIAVPSLAFAAPAQAHLGGEVYAVPAASFVVGLLAGGFAVAPFSRTHKQVLLAVVICTVFALLIPMALAQLPGTRGVRLFLWWFFLASALLYLPYQFGRLVKVAVNARLRKSSASPSGPSGGAGPGAP